MKDGTQMVTNAAKIVEKVEQTFFQKYGMMMFMFVFMIGTQVSFSLLFCSWSFEMFNLFLKKSYLVHEISHEVLILYAAFIVVKRPETAFWFTVPLAKIFIVWRVHYHNHGCQLQ